MSAVYLERCRSYDFSELRPAVTALWHSVGGAELVAGRRRVLLKPNVINSMPPERAVCTHPHVVRVIAELVLQSGAEVLIADQPGYALADDAPRAFAGSGLLEACNGLDVQFALLASGGYRAVPIANAVHIAKAQVSAMVLDADLVINIPKVKSHSQTVLTCCIKNMFGVIAPRQRLQIHLLGRANELAEALADTYSAHPPQLHIVDGIIGMDGFGPTRGNPCPMGFLAAANDGVAADAVVQQILALGPQEVHTTTAAAQLGMGEADPARITIHGPAPESLRIPFERPAQTASEFPPFLGPLIYRIVSARPNVVRRRCRACGACAGICPAQAVEMGKIAHIDREKCVECFCCMEACPYDAIGLRRSRLYELMMHLRRLFQRKKARTTHGSCGGL